MMNKIQRAGHTRPVAETVYTRPLDGKRHDRARAEQTDRTELTYAVGFLMSWAFYSGYTELGTYPPEVDSAVVAACVRSVINAALAEIGERREVETLRADKAALASQVSSYEIEFERMRAELSAMVDKFGPLKPDAVPANPPRPVVPAKEFRYPEDEE